MAFLVMYPTIFSLQLRIGCSLHALFHLTFFVLYPVTLNCDHMDQIITHLKFTFPIFCYLVIIYKEGVYKVLSIFFLAILESKITNK